MRPRFDAAVVRVADAAVYWACRAMMRGLLRSGQLEPSAFAYLLHKRIQMGPRIDAR